MSASTTRMGLTRRSTSTATLSFVLLVLLQFCGVAARTYTVEDGGSIQDALDQVRAGDTIEISKGHYFEDIMTKTDGTKSGPITIKGKSGTKASDVVLRGDGRWVMFQIMHDYYVIKDFTVDGKAPGTANSKNYEDVYRNKLIYVLADRARTRRSGGHYSAIDGLEIKDMIIKNGGAECIRLRYFVTYAKIHNNEIVDCGIHDFRFDDGGKTGEGIYIGTSNTQWKDRLMPTKEVDVCRYISVYDNIITTKGNEGIQTKEGTTDVLIDNNEVYLQLDDNSGGIDCRGDNCLIRNNYIKNAEGAGIRLGGSRVSGRQYGVGHNVYDNEMVNCEYTGIKVEAPDQGVICENSITPPSGDSKYKSVRGKYSDDYKEFDVKCRSKPNGVFSSSPSPSPSPNPSPTPAASGPGCYKDTRNNRIMSYGYKSGGLTNESCALYCKDKGNDYSGTQNSDECWCTDSSDFNEHGTSDDCTYDCKGDDDEKCGGYYAMSVMETDDVDSPDSVDLEYKGCYQDRSDRAMDDAILKRDPNMTLEKCVRFCDDEGEKYAGTQWGQECWCGSDYDRYGKSSRCDMECTGDDDQICGGYFALSVYKV